MEVIHRIRSHTCKIGHSTKLFINEQQHMVQLAASPCYNIVLAVHLGIIVN